MDNDQLAGKVAHAMLAAEGTGPAWGIVIEETRAGYARVSMIVRPDMLNGHGMMHGGMIFALADSAFARRMAERSPNLPAIRAPLAAPSSTFERWALSD